MPIATGSFLFLLPLLVVWIFYSALRLANYVCSRRPVAGEAVAFLLFFTGSMALEILLVPS